MTERNKVVWSEGLFLRTQHFQQQDRYTEGLMRAALQAAPWQSFGFTSLQLDKAALDAGSLAIARAEGLLPDGTAFSIPESMAAPAMDIKEKRRPIQALAAPSVVLHSAVRK